MSHFAELDENSIVLRVVVFDGEGLEGEAAVCAWAGGGRWKQTSYTGRIRGKFAGIGDRYNEADDEFEAQAPPARAVTANMPIG